VLVGGGKVGVELGANKGTAGMAQAIETTSHTARNTVKAL
jgi:hypothetical protein